MRTTDASEHLPLRSVEFEILLTLVDGDRHGYAIIQETEARSDGELKLGTGTMYRALRRLVSAGFVRAAARAPASADPDDERRRYYAITSTGKQVAAAEAARMARLVKAARVARLIPKAAQ